MVGTLRPLLVHSCPRVYHTSCPLTPLAGDGISLSISISYVPGSRFSSILQYKAAIAACCRAQQSVAALTLLGDMSLEASRARGDGRGAGDATLRPDETTYVWVMRVFGKEGR